MKRKYRIISAEKFNQEIFGIAKNPYCHIYISKRMLHKLITDRCFNIHFMRSSYKIYADRPECDGLYIDPIDFQIDYLIANGKQYNLANQDVVEKVFFI